MILALIFVCLVAATPPACFLSCINELARSCPENQVDIQCLCSVKDSLLGCLVDICPYGNFESARDHYLGTCLEHLPQAILKGTKTTQSKPKPTPKVLTAPKATVHARANNHKAKFVSEQKQSVDAVHYTGNQVLVQENFRPETVRRKEIRQP